MFQKVTINQLKIIFKIEFPEKGI